MAVDVATMEQLMQQLECYLPYPIDQIQAQEQQQKQQQQSYLLRAEAVSTKIEEARSVSTAEQVMLVSMMMMMMKQQQQHHHHHHHHYY